MYMLVYSNLFVKTVAFFVEKNRMYKRCQISEQLKRSFRKEKNAPAQNPAGKKYRYSFGDDSCFFAL